jgi:hypothetical protein
MPSLFDAAQALDNRTADVWSRASLDSVVSRGDLALAMSRLEDGAVVASAALAREARLGRSDTDEFQRLAESEAQAREVLAAGGEVLAAGKPSSPATVPGLPFGLELPPPSSMFVGGVIGFGLAWLALYWAGRRGR